jgi:UDP-N-acetylmuramyl pentapeptide synthase
VKKVSVVRGLAHLYSLRLARELVVAFRTHDGSVAAYLRWFHRTRTFRVAGSIAKSEFSTAQLLVVVLVSQVVIGLGLVVCDWQGGWGGYGALGFAVLLAAPVVTAYVFAFATVVLQGAWYVWHPKRLGKAVVAHLLAAQVRQLRRRHHFVVVAVAGSVGKTSTKIAVAQLLGQQLRVLYQEGNYNDSVTVPLVFFGQSEPNLFNPFAWMRVFGENAARLHQPYPYDVVVVELGTDGPGQMKQFVYVKPDITVLTAITPEHMEYFGTLGEVANEELTVFDYSKHVLVNVDMVPAKYLTGHEYSSYSLEGKLARMYYATRSQNSLGGQELQIQTPSGKITAYVGYLGAQGAACALAAAAVADLLGVPRLAIKEALSTLEPFPGRMRVLEGLKGSKLIDDTYNATPVATTAALDVLYWAPAQQRIALLGSMNELGEYSKEAHEIVGTYCDPRKLDMVVTLGADAGRWLAPAARAQGCKVHTFSSHASASAFIRKHVKPRAVILVKGSQNGVFAEEVVKQLLAHPADAKKLVRQSPQWLKQKYRA